MPAIVIVGAQWGDEAKGKIVDFLAADADIVVRYNGGNNAGHTVVVGGETYKLHLIPCGILYPDTICIIGDGQVVDPGVLVGEMDDLTSRGASIEGLKISLNAHVIMPYHRLLDGLEERRKGGKAIGTTNRGIGPAYADKASRIGIRVAELIDPDRFRARLAENLALKNDILTKVYEVPALSFDDILNEYLGYAEKIRPYVANTNYIVHEGIMAGKDVLFEGAQGTLLDIDYGTYPYVTSSHVVAGGACLGTGVGPMGIDRVIGIGKSYTTRVGAGVFPTEQINKVGEYIREKGHEYGTTTGRARRCGWLDAVALRYTVMVNGLSELALTLLDVLGGLDTLKICRAYICNGEETDKLPGDWEAVNDCTPIYDELPGWTEDISTIRDFDDLPANAKAYVRRVEELIGVPVSIISVGPHREDTIIRD
ncbi:MAG TPA: adenylosuccinate synthase [Armatimonadetes bacterium]|nr:adenylosuccinate synthase [Armatimonadota bacterium]